MNKKSKKLTFRTILGVLVAGAGFIAWQQVSYLANVQEKVSGEQFNEQVQFAQTLYSRNLQALELASAVQTSSAEEGFVLAASVWKSNITESNVRIKDWLNEKRVLNQQGNSQSKELNIQELQLRQAVNSFNEELVAQAIQSLTVKALDVAATTQVDSDELIAIAESIVSADVKILEAALFIIEEN